ncbi:MAG: hypothetical protein ABI680_00040 [Chthoniobacteraceae bacterium]
MAELGGREFVDAKPERHCNELRGHFYEQGGFHSSADQEAEIRLVENGPLRVMVEISSQIADYPGHLARLDFPRFAGD